MKSISKIKPKPKRPSLPSLITKADNLASKYIRQKFADSNGNVTCITCGKVLPWQDSHCAHFIGRNSKILRWREENLKPACPRCNSFQPEFHAREYTLYMIDAHGREFVDQLRAEAKTVLSASQVRSLAEAAIEEFSVALNGIK